MFGCQTATAPQGEYVCLLLYRRALEISVYRVPASTSVYILNWGRPQPNGPGEDNIGLELGR